MTASWSGDPRTWVDQETPSALQFNTEFRDRFDFLSIHAHTGADGDGSSTLDSLDHIDWDEGGALSEPVANHTRFAANTDGSLRYRANGDTEKEISDTTHSHTIASSTETKADSETGASVGTSYGNSVSLNFTPSDSTGTEHYATVQFAACEMENVSGTGGTVYQRILKGGVQQQEVSATLANPINSEIIIQQSYVHIEPANSSTSFAQENKRDGGVGATNVVMRSVLTREVRCQ